MDPFVGEIRMFSFVWAPRGWAACTGAQLQVRQNPALFSLIGNKFGGDGVNNFNLPDLRGRVPLGQGQYVDPAGTAAYQIGNTGGSETVTLTQPQIPQHIHTTNVVTTTGNSPAPGANLLAQPGVYQNNPVIAIYAPRGGNAPVALAASTVSSSGGAPHPNLQPWAVTNYCIATTGVYPSRP
ncbi:phage tail protein [Oleisolibacter albus]|uniref:phage tail protein n=1 Tax=Oleisolibacter albus TaxID=2171757 RepID=UPI00138FAE76|nr:tail fiber protein [Oleisolibacter albus]